MGRVFLLVILFFSTFSALSVKAQNPYYRYYYCNSQYVGPYGWGYYYGYALYPNYSAAYNNAQLACQLQHGYDPYNCVVTSCYIR